MILVDALSEFEYARGLVSIRLKASAFSASSVELAIPFAAFSEIVGSIKAREAEFTRAHSNWLASEAANLAAIVEPLTEEAEPPPKLGRRLASV